MSSRFEIDSQNELQKSQFKPSNYDVLMKFLGINVPSKQVVPFKECVDLMLSESKKAEGIKNKIPDFVVDGNKVDFLLGTEADLSLLLVYASRFPTLVVGSNSEQEDVYHNQCYRALYDCFGLEYPCFETFQYDVPTLKEILDDLLPKFWECNFEVTQNIPDFLIVGQLIHFVSSSSKTSTKTVNDLIDLEFSSKHQMFVNGQLDYPMFHKYKNAYEGALLRLFFLFPMYWNMQEDEFTIHPSRLILSKKVSSEARLNRYEVIMDYWKKDKPEYHSAMLTLMKVQNLTFIQVSKFEDLPTVFDRHVKVIPKKIMNKILPCTVRNQTVSLKDPDVLQSKHISFFSPSDVQRANSVRISLLKQGEIAHSKPVTVVEVPVIWNLNLDQEDKLLQHNLTFEIISLYCKEQLFTVKFVKKWSQPIVFEVNRLSSSLSIKNVMLPENKADFTLIEDSEKKSPKPLVPIVKLEQSRIDLESRAQPALKSLLQSILKLPEPEQNQDNKRPSLEDNALKVELKEKKRIKESKQAFNFDPTDFKVDSIYNRPLTDYCYWMPKKISYSPVPSESSSSGEENLTSFEKLLSNEKFQQSLKAYDQGDKLSILTKKQIFPTKIDFMFMNLSRSLSSEKKDEKSTPDLENFKDASEVFEEVVEFNSGKEVINLDPNLGKDDEKIVDLKSKKTQKSKKRKQKKQTKNQAQQDQSSSKKSVESSGNDLNEGSDRKSVSTNDTLDKTLKNLVKAQNTIKVLTQELHLECKAEQKVYPNLLPADKILYPSTDEHDELDKWLSEQIETEEALALIEDSSCNRSISSSCKERYAEVKNVLNMYTQELSFTKSMKLRGTPSNFSSKSSSRSRSEVKSWRKPILNDFLTGLTNKQASLNSSELMKVGIFGRPVSKQTWVQIQERKKKQKSFQPFHFGCYAEAVDALIRPFGGYASDLFKDNRQHCISEYWTEMVRRHKMSEFGVLSIEINTCMSCDNDKTEYTYWPYAVASLSPISTHIRTCTLCKKETQQIDEMFFMFSEYCLWLNVGLMQHLNNLSDQEYNYDMIKDDPVQIEGDFLAGIHYEGKATQGHYIFSENPNLAFLTRTNGNLPPAFIQHIIEGKPLRRLATELDFDRKIELHIRLTRQNRKLALKECQQKRLAGLEAEVKD